MATLPILKYPDPKLREPCKMVERFDDELRQLASDMLETMHAAPGIGLAAAQVGREERLIVVDLSVGEDPEQQVVLVNPEVVDEEGKERDDEGCLSFPDVILTIARPGRIVVEARSIDGEPVRLEAEGLLARCLHHEVDHLLGVLFVDHVSPLKRDLTRRRIDRRIRAGDW